MKKTLILMLCMIFLITTVTALEFDNIKTYDQDTRTATFKNSFLGIPTTEIAKVTLNTPLNVKVGLGYQKVAEFKVTGFTDYQDFIKELEFYDLNKKSEKVERTFDLRVRSEEEFKVTDYKSVCEEKVNEKNGTKYESCTQIESGSHLETREVWLRFNPTDIKAEETLIIGIFVDVQLNDKIEWVPTIAGKKINEWAIYTQIFFNDFNSGSSINTTEWNVNSTGGSSSISASILTLTSSTNQQYFATTKQNFTGDIRVGSRLRFVSSTDGTTFFGITNETNSRPENMLGVYYNAFVDSKCRSMTPGAEQVFNGCSTGTWYYAEINNTGNNYQMCLYTDNKVSVINCSSVYTWSSVPKYVKVGVYNGYPSGTSYSNYDNILVESVSYDNLPTVVLNTPTNNTNYLTSPIVVNFSCNASDDINLTEVKLLINGLVDQTNASGLNATTYTFSKSLNSGSYTWSCQAFDNSSQSTTAPLRNILIETDQPILTVYSPLTNFTTLTLPYYVNLSVNSSDATLSTCWYNTNENLTNKTYTCNTNQNLTFTTGGSKIINVYANDTVGHLNTTAINFFINYIKQNATYQSNVIEAENNTLYFNLTASQILNFTGTLYYNGTAYNTTASNNGTYGTLRTTLQAPTVTSNQNKSFYWTFNLNGVNYNSSTFYQQILFLTPIFLSTSCVDKTLNFTLTDEENLTNLNGTIDYNFRYGITNSSYKTVYGTLSNVNNFFLCINASVSQNYTIGYGELQYKSSGYVDRRYYVFENQIISNNTLNNITLKDLLSLDQTSFLLTLEDTSLNIYSNVYSALWRWYPELNQYQIVEMGKTDEDGQTVVHVNAEDTDYRVGVYNLDGTLIKLSEPKRFLCTSAPCSFTIRVDAQTNDYISILGIEGSLDYNETTNVFTLIYNDPSQKTSNMRLVVTRETGTDTLVICNSSSSQFTGVISCNTSAYSGMKKATVYRSASPPVIWKTLTYFKQNTALRSTFGLFISAIFWLAIVLTGFGSSVILTVLLGVIGLIPALAFGAINYAIFTGIVTLAVIVIHFIKRVLA